MRKTPDNAGTRSWDLSRLGLLAIALFIGGCGPSEEEVGSAVLLAGPLICLAATGAIELLERLWRPVFPKPAERRWPWWLVFAASAALAGIALIAPAKLDDEMTDLVFTAFWTVGSIYLVLVLLVWRATLRGREGGSMSPRAGGHLAVAALMLLPAVPLALFGKRVEIVSVLYVYAAVLGIYVAPVAAVLLTGLLIEARWRGMQK
jgi:hypothetical protein